MTLPRRSRPRAIPLRTFQEHTDDHEDELDGLLDPEAVDSQTQVEPVINSTAFWKTSSSGNDPAHGIRRVNLGDESVTQPSNYISNAKYNAFTFIPFTLFEQFRYFFNLYFLLVALSQFIPALKIGFLSTYIAPLTFVLVVTMAQEAMDDIARRRRDNEANSELYDVLGVSERSKSSDLRVGHIIRVAKDQRMPADTVLLRTEEDDGEVFVRTDQLDGETDWKLKIACTKTQRAAQEYDLSTMHGFVLADPPTKSIHTFNGSLHFDSHDCAPTSLTADNAIWANSVIASGSSVWCLIVYTGVDTRQSLNTSTSRVKSGLLEQEINGLSKVLCILTLLLSFALVAFHGFSSAWYVDVIRFLILFSTIIPISLRVNLDLGKNLYAHQIQRDESIRGTIVRTSTIPEDLGRIGYLLTDKTGTLTRNEMEMKKLHVGTVSYSGEAMEEVLDYVLARPIKPANHAVRSRRDINVRIRDVVLALALCHNVTPTTSSLHNELTYQAASPDELAIVKWTASVGLELVHRDRKSLRLRRGGEELRFEILQIFPFTSESKRMSIIVKDEDGVITFYQKGADAVMANIVAANDWLDEEGGNMAREGLRTLVIGKRVLTTAAYRTFVDTYGAASLLMTGRDSAMSKVIESLLEQNLELIGLTGVEDKLQDSVKVTLEFLRNAGIKVWMLTGDKVETAKCIAISARLVGKGQYIHTITKLRDAITAMRELEFLQTRQDIALLIDGDSLQYFLDKYASSFIDYTTKLPAVICCRCTPTQKADVAKMIREITNLRVACIGDGGNDVSMIQAADVGLGIPGKEGRQASLAADFSVPEFHYLMKLLVWHGRNSYKRSAKLAQFVIHRGLIISICQIVFSVTSKFAPVALFPGWLMVGYATIYTMMPVFSLALDRDLDESLALLYPELYKELTKGLSLSYRTFLEWVVVSVYQGITIMLATLLVQRVPDEKMVTISFTALITNELIMVALEVNTWHRIMSYSILASVLLYVTTVPFLGEYFALHIFLEATFYWKTTFVVATSIAPIWAVRKLRRRLRPPDYAKVAGTA